MTITTIIDVIVKEGRLIDSSRTVEAKTGRKDKEILQRMIEEVAVVGMMNEEEGGVTTNEEVVAMTNNAAVVGITQNGEVGGVLIVKGDGAPATVEVEVAEEVEDLIIEGIVVQTFKVDEEVATHILVAGSLREIMNVLRVTAGGAIRMIVEVDDLLTIGEINARTTN